VILGALSWLQADYHLNRFPGAERVLSIAVKEVRQVVAKPSSQGVPPALLGPEVSGPQLEPPPADHPEMQIVRINVSMPKTIQHGGRDVSTGIFKQPVDGPVAVRFLNLEGDGQADLWAHGGSFRSVYVYPAEHYDYWASELRRDDFGPGQFGENFTVVGMLENEIRVGDRFRIGTALVEVSQPRVPCFKLAIKMGIENFQARFLKEGRLGFYLRVLEEGQVSAGDRFEFIARDPHGMSVRAVSDLLYFDRDDLDATRQALSIGALSQGWKVSFEERLQKASRSGFREFVVKRRVPESESITSFYLEPKDRDPLSPFKPGQFLTFRLNIPGSDEPVLRTYSLSDSPHCPYYRVSIKRESSPPDVPDAPPGLSSNYFHDRVKEGSILDVGAPRGSFVIDDDTDRTLVLLSAGVGITPLLSMLNTVAKSGRKVWFIHGARNGREHAFGEHVRRLASEHDNVRVHVAYSAPEDSDVEGRDYDSRGRVSVDLLKRILPFDDYAFYLVGPPPFMRGLFSGFCAMGVDAGRIRYEFFGPASALQEPPKTSQRDAEVGNDGTEVVFANSGVTATWNGQGSLLDLAERVGLTPPYSCRAGICHTCQCGVIEGEIGYDEEPLSPPDSGEALICVGKPKGRVVLDL
jgi:ferredoxin-NADP reductase/MOSC domain-containing protein YiiM